MKLVSLCNKLRLIRLVWVTSVALQLLLHPDFFIRTSKQARESPHSQLEKVMFLCTCWGH